MTLGRRLKPAAVQLFDGEGSVTTSSVTMEVADYRHIVVAVSATLNASLTFNFKGSVLPTAPTFSSAQAVTNVWDYVGVYDMASGSFVDGDTGVTINNDTVANNTRQYLINTDHLQFLTMEITAWTDGDLSAWAMASN